MGTEKVTLRPFNAADQEQILDILTSNKVNKTYMLPDYETRADAVPLFQRLMALSENSQRFVRCIDLNGTAIGFLNDVEIENGTIELGYVIHPDHHNRGYMTKALSIAIGDLFAMGYKCVVCGAFEGNNASMRVMEKGGMKKLDKTDEIEYRGTVHRCIYYHIRNEGSSC